MKPRAGRAAPAAAASAGASRALAVRSAATVPATAGDAPWLSGAPGHWVLQLWAQPGAQRTGCVGVFEGRLKVRLAAPPVEGRANEALVAWVAAQLDLPRRDVELASGATSRFKRLRVASTLAREPLVARLLAAS